MPKQAKMMTLPFNFLQKRAERQKEFAESYIKNWDDFQVRIDPKTGMLQPVRKPGKKLPKKGGWRRPTLEEWQQIINFVVDDLKKGEDMIDSK